MSIYHHFSENEIDILRERAERVARDNTQQDVQTVIAALVVTIRNEVYALPVEYIVTIYEDVPIVSVPSVPAHVRGIANLRGHITPVIDLGVLLNVTGNSEALDTYYLIVVSHHGLTAALFVEQVGDIADFNDEDIQSLADDADEKSPIVRGMMPSGETLIDMAHLLQDNYLAVRGKA